ncbi:MAG TPA: glycosyltransferase family 39 protein, partial [Terriglobales bacterium]|nr:glycosyltransferase family 39 protein [Terriglobales bacterium]
MRPTPHLTERARRSTDTLALIALCGYLFLLGLQLIGLLGADEPRYAQVAREMLARHDWVTPYLYGVPWLEKPPLYYWCAMLAYKAAGGVSDVAARVPSAVLSSLLIVFIYVWARRFRRGMQLDAALITASAVMVIGFGRSASTDMPLTVMFTIAMLSWYGWHMSKARSWLLAFYLFLGLATLAKGPVAVFLAALIIIAFAVLRREGRLLLRTLWPFGIALYLVVTAPWFIAVQRANPEFFRVFFLQHNLERFASNLYHHPEPFWFYLPVALVALVPWTVFVVEAIVDALRDWRFSTQQPAGEEDLRTYLALWLLLPIIFFSFSQSKLAGYILPAIPAGTILLADFILRREQEGVKPAIWLALLHALLAAAMLVAAFIVPFKLLKLTLPWHVIAVAATLAIVTILMLWFTLQSQGYRILRFATLVPVVVAFALVLRGTAPMINILLSERPVQAELE